MSPDSSVQMLVRNDSLTGRQLAELVERFHDGPAGHVEKFVQPDGTFAEPRGLQLGRDIVAALLARRSVTATLTRQATMAQVRELEELLAANVEELQELLGKLRNCRQLAEQERKRVRGMRRKTRRSLPNGCRVEHPEPWRLHVTTNEV